MFMAPPEVSAPYLDDSGENQLWEANAVGLAMEILQHQVIGLVNESVLSRRNTKQVAGYNLNPADFPQQLNPTDFPGWERHLQPLGTGHGAHSLCSAGHREPRHGWRPRSHLL